LLAASLKAIVEVVGVPQAAAKLSAFQGKLESVSRSSAVANLSADLNTKGFDEYESVLAKAKGADATADLGAKVDAAGFNDFAAKLVAVKALTKDPIIQQIKFTTDGALEVGLARAAAGSGGGGGDRGLIGRAFWGGGSKLPWLGAAAGAGSIGAFAGFGAEHFLFTGLGLAGSAGAATLGGGLIAAGALGQAAVGGGSDLAAMKSTISGAQSLGKAYEALDKAVALYGAHSKQAALAQANLTLAMQEAGGGKGAKAELKLAKNADALSEFWKQATQGARVQAAKVLEQVVGLGHAYIPKVAHAAEQNLAIIDQGLKPLFNWLEGPKGMGVFNQLEGQFKKNLPTAIHAFDQAVEFVLKTLGVASHYTGGFVASINSFFTKWNEPQNFAKWKQTIGNLVGDFHLWLNLIKTLGQDIFGLFTNDAHTGNAIVLTITHMLEKVREWERSTAGKESLHNIFQVHKEEIVALLKLLPTFVNAFAPIYLTVAPPLVKVVTLLAEGLGKVLTALEKVSSAFTWVFGGTLLVGKIVGFKTLFGALGKWMLAPFAGLLAKAPLIGGFFGTAVSETEGLTLATEGLTTAVGELTAAYQAAGLAAGGLTLGGGAAGGAEIGAGITAQKQAALGIGEGASAGLLAAAPAAAPWLAFGAAVAAAGVGFYELYKHSKTFREIVAPVGRAAAQAFDQVKAALAPLGAALAELSHLTGAHTGFIGDVKEMYGQLRGPIDAVSALFGGVLLGGVKGVFEELAQIIKGFGASFAGAMQAIGGIVEVIAGILTGKFGHAWKGVENIFSGSLKAVVGFVEAATSPLRAGVEAIASALHGTFHGMWSGIEGVFKDGINTIVGFLNDLIGLVDELPFINLHTIGGASVAHGIPKHQNVATIHRARGGHINLGAPSGDSVPAMLERGEYVLNRNAVAAIGGPQALDSINFGAAPRFATGGPIGSAVNAAASTVGGGISNLLGEGASAGIGAVLGALPGVPGGLPWPLPQFGDWAKHELVGYVQGQNKKFGKLSGAVGYVPGGGGPVVAQIARVLFAAGFNKIGATGPIGNSYAESTWNPAAMEPGTDNGGLWGFTAGEKSLASLRAYAAKMRKPWTDVGLQTAFMLNTGGLSIRSRLNAAKTPAEAARIFEELYEHAGVVRMNVREAGARKAYAMGYRRGGLVEEAEHQRGVAGSHHTAHEHATPAKAVQWAMRHLGQTNDYGYPGEWCGAFLAADMKSQGLPVPADYPAAASWAAYGTPLGKNNMQAGAVIDYGHQHVALATSASKMVSGNWGGTVATSPIESAVKGTPITAVRWPPYGSGPGAGSTPAEKVPAVFHGARTASLSFPSIPKSAHGITKEIKRWTHELKVYEQAARAAKGMPSTQAAIQKNVTAIQKQLRELERARVKVRGEAAKRHFTHRLTSALGKVTGQEKSIEGARRAYEMASQYAEQVVGLEPQEPASAAEYESYVNGSERPAYEKVLNAEADWRNIILGAQGTATSLEANWEYRIRGKEAELKSIQRYAEDVAKRVAAWREKNPKGGLPEKLRRELADRKDLLAQLPTIRFEDRELRKILGEGRAEFYPGVKGAIEPPPTPLAGTGTLETSLQEVQGIHWPEQHEHLAAAALAPPRHAGSFGGAIWDTQGAIEELGLKIKQAQANIAGAGSGVGSPGQSERESLLETLLRQANQRELVRQIGEKTIAGFPYAGAYAAGGIVSALVGERGPELATFPSGTRITPADKTKRLLASHTPHMTIQELHVHGDGSVTMKYDDREFEAAVGKVVRKTTGVGRPTPGLGARI
jgi:tail lysozyme